MLESEIRYARTSAASQSQLVSAQRHVNGEKGQK